MIEDAVSPGREIVVEPGNDNDPIKTVYILEKKYSQTFAVHPPAFTLLFKTVYIENLVSPPIFSGHRESKK